MRSVWSLLLALYIGDFGVAAAPQRRDSLTPKVVTSCVTAKTVALTFDDGPWKYLEDVSKALVAANATGTFFFNDCIYSDAAVAHVKYAYSHGHQIGSHTWAHKDLTTLSRDQIHDEMWRVELALKRIIGVVPAFMRPPYGNYNDQVQQVSFSRGQSLAIWDFDSGDSIGATVAKSEKDYDSLIAKHPKNILALNHETVGMHQVLPYAIKKLQAAGYRLVSLSECTGMPAYQSVGAPGTKDSSWKC
ncbi:carbohydrate esterase family 4 protein [Mycena floridula]|nr:carbohydrate esterase family 4 protein [Mycena floridula]